MDILVCNGVKEKYNSRMYLRRYLRKYNLRRYTSRKFLGVYSRRYSLRKYLRV